MTVIPRRVAIALPTARSVGAANFSIADHSQWEDKDGAEHKNTDWFQIQVWGPLAKFAVTLRAKPQFPCP